MIETRDLTVSYGGVEALHATSLEFQAGQVTALIGPSGCGKSTFLRCLNLMNREIPGCRVGGSILYHGRDVNTAKENLNSFYLLVLTLLISVPISLGAAIFLAEYAPDNRATAIAKTLIETLSSLPSIVVGLFGFLFFVLYLGWGFSIIAGAVALTMFNVPILVRVIQQALENVPRTQRDAALAMGLTRWETTIHVLLPVAMPAIVTGIVLSAGRVFGEAAALIFTAGQSAPMLDFTNFDLSSPACPWNVFRPAETLAVHIWKINSEGVVPDLEAVSNGTAAVLLVCILAFNLLARLVGKLLERRMTSE